MAKPYFSNFIVWEIQFWLRPAAPLESLAVCLAIISQYKIKVLPF